MGRLEWDWEYLSLVRLEELFFLALVGLLAELSLFLAKRVSPDFLALVAWALVLLLEVPMRATLVFLASLCLDSLCLASCRAAKDGVPNIDA